MEINEKKEEEPAASNVGEGNKPEEITLIAKANEAAERLELANKKQEELLNRQEKLLAERILSGKSTGGDLLIQEKKELTPEEAADLVLKGQLNPFKSDERI